MKKRGYRESNQNMEPSMVQNMESSGGPSKKTSKKPNKGQSMVPNKSPSREPSMVPTKDSSSRPSMDSDRGRGKVMKLTKPDGSFYLLDVINKVRKSTREEVRYTTMDFLRKDLLSEEIKWSFRRLLKQGIYHGSHTESS